MRITLYKFSAMLLVAVAVAGCKKDNEIAAPAPMAEFADAANGNEGKYFILDDPNSVFEIPVGISNVSNVDRTIEFSVSSPTGAEAGTHYTIPGNNIVVPAGTALAKIPVKGIFANYPTGRKDILEFTITGGDVPVWEKYNTYTLEVQKFCNVVLDDLDGDFTDTRETASNGSNPYGPYTSAVTLTPIPGVSTKANITFHNFWDSGFEITGTIDWSDPANLKVVIPLQYMGDWDTDQPMDVRTSSGKPSTFSSCDQTYELSVDIIINNYDNTGTSIYYDQGYKIYIKR